MIDLITLKDKPTPPRGFVNGFFSGHHWGMKGKKNIVYVDGHEFVSEQTKQIEKRFKCSRPKPSNEGCGFKGRNGKKKAWVERMLGIGK